MTELLNRPVSIPTPDQHTLAMMRKTAEGLMKLAGLRGISANVEVSDNAHYIANGCDCGPSTFGFYDWLNKQPGVKP